MREEILGAGGLLIILGIGVLATGTPVRPAEAHGAVAPRTGAERDEAGPAIERPRNADAAKGGSIAEDVESLKKDVKSLQDEVEQLRKEKATSAEGAGSDPEPRSGFLTRMREPIEIGGDLELEYVDTQSERNAAFNWWTDEPAPHFQVDRFRLKPLIEFTREVRMSAQLDFKPRRARLKEAWVQVRNLDIGILESRFKFGLDDRFMKPRRRTEIYPLVGTALWRDESVAFKWETRIAKADDPWGELRIHFSVGDGYTLDRRRIGEDDGNIQAILHDNRKTQDYAGIREVGVGIGYLKDIPELAALEALAFYYDGLLSREDTQFLRTVYQVPLGPSYISSVRHQSLAGVQGGCEIPLSRPPEIGRFVETNLLASGQFVRGKAGKVTRQGWYAQGSLEFRFREVSKKGKEDWAPLLFGKYLRSFEPLVRYGRLDVGIDGFHRNPNVPESWDREQWTLALITRVHRNVWLKGEYTVNRERTGGGGDVNNDELLVQLKVEF